jgi:hypothetical protein
MRRLMIVVLALLATAGGGSLVVWRWAEGQLADGFAAWRGAMLAHGWTVATGPAGSGGWPFAAELTLPDLTVTAGPELPAGAAWHAALVTLRVAFLQPRALVARVDGPQSVRYGDDPPLAFTAGRFTVTVSLPSGAPPAAAALDAAGIRFAPPAGGLTIGLLEGQAAWHMAAGAGQPAVSVRLSAEAIALPPAPARLLGPNIASATFESTLTGPLPPPGAPHAMAAAWRDAGGTLDISRLAVGWGPLGVTGGASLSFDDAMQPTGTARLRLVGYDDALGALVAGNVLPPHMAQAVKAMLGLLAAPADGGGAAGVEVPLTLRDQTLAVGMFPLARLPRLLWPDAPGSAKLN